MFLGMYTHNLDAKGRLTVPARFRELLEGGAYITQGFERNLMVLPPLAFENLSNRVNEMSITDPTARQLKRLLFAAADLVDMDRSGRIRIPQFLREVAGLDSETIIVGAGNYFEIWSPAKWQEQADLLKDTDANTEKFAVLDIATPM